MEQCFVCPIVFSKTSGICAHTRAQNEPADFLLSQADGSNRGVIRMTARYVPVQIALEPRESINSESSATHELRVPAELIIDMGILRVEVIGAKNIMAGDRSGKSDVGPPSCLYARY